MNYGIRNLKISGSDQTLNFFNDFVKINGTCTTICPDSNYYKDSVD